ncbi:hypothetical protein M7I_2410 [Glarea lozoyensis 74030]|uniref:Uncharacterized protein n=1 Tax=Glarea lozoyensis (strain ATCC 74030 / MF5533) TaxID=1104152 RepID=H0EIP7_GLAL7|nr:hypothetical protein M7I_2410 [Glarea lozoyensis 74030]
MKLCLIQLFATISLVNHVLAAARSESEKPAMEVCKKTLNCPRNATFSIGQMNLASNSSISRSSWDNNPFYMNLQPRDEILGDVVESRCFSRHEDWEHHHIREIKVLQLH